MSKKDVVIFGTGDLASVAYFYFTNDSEFNVVAFTVDQKFRQEEQFHSLPVLAFEEIEKYYPPDRFAMFVAIAYTGLNKVRATKYREAKAKGYSLVSYVNSRTIRWDDLIIGDNCFILENVVIQPFVRINNDVIVWSGTHIGHHSIIGNHCFITSHCVISGNVHLGPYCFVGVNATLRDGITVGEECIIGAGALLLKDAKAREVYGGKGTEAAPYDSTRIRNI